MTRADLQHNLWILTLKGALCLCPKEQGAKRVLDIGTGTGIWAIEYGKSPRPFPPSHPSSWTKTQNETEVARPNHLVLCPECVSQEANT